MGRGLRKRWLWIYAAGWLLFALGGALHLSAASKPPSIAGVLNVLFGLPSIGFLVTLFSLVTFLASAIAFLRRRQLRAAVGALISIPIAVMITWNLTGSRLNYLRQLDTEYLDGHPYALVVDVTELPSDSLPNSVTQFYLYECDILAIVCRVLWQSDPTSGIWMYAGDISPVHMVVSNNTIQLLSSSGVPIFSY
jgi:hypothetical protein